MASEARKDGGPAFPGEYDTVLVDTAGVRGPFTIAARQKGMSLRDYFAAQALGAMVSAYYQHPHSFDELVAEAAYKYADAMLKAREATRD